MTVRRREPLDPASVLLQDLLRPGAQQSPVIVEEDGPDPSIVDGPLKPLDIRDRQFRSALGHHGHTGAVAGAAAAAAGDGRVGRGLGGRKDQGTGFGDVADTSVDEYGSGVGALPAQRRWLPRSMVLGSALISMVGMTSAGLVGGRHRRSVGGRNRRGGLFLAASQRQHQQHTGNELHSDRKPLFIEPPWKEKNNSQGRVR